MAQHPESAYRLPDLEEQSFQSRTGETFTAHEITADEVPEFLRSIVGAHAVEGFGEAFAVNVYQPNDPGKHKSVIESIAERADGGISPRRIAVRDESGDIVHTLKDGVAMYDDVNPLIDSKWRQKVRTLTAHLPGFHAVSVWPADVADGAYYREDAATHPEYRRTGVALHTAFLALDSIFKAQNHPLAGAPALSFVAVDTASYQLHSHPFLTNLGFIETGRTMPFNEKITDVQVREMRAPKTTDVHARLARKLARSTE